MTHIINQYETLINPDNFFKNWTNDEFIEWCETGTEKDLECLLKELERVENYKLCAIVKTLIK